MSLWCRGKEKEDERAIKNLSQTEERAYRQTNMGLQVFDDPAAIYRLGVRHPTCAFHGMWWG